MFPTPVLLTYTSLSCSVNRLALYEQLKSLHPGYNHTICKEIERFLPCYIYEFNSSGNWKKLNSIPLKQNVDEDITFEQGTKWMYSICRDTIDTVTNHPKLKDLEIQLPLTSGLDSRHILGQLLELDKKPAVLRHIKLVPEDYEPVKQMSTELVIPLNSPTFYELDLKELIQLWIERTSGLVNIHQFYFLSLTQDVPQNGAVSFNGYLMDKFLGISPRFKAETDEDLFKAIANKSYSGRSILKALMHDSSLLEGQLADYYKTHISTFEGETWYKAGLHEMNTRGLHYTAIVDSMVADDIFSFSPGASSQSLKFFSTISREVGGRKKIRLNAMKKYFPKVAMFPDSDGIPLLEKLERPKKSTSPLLKNISPLLKYLFSGFSGDPAPHTEHAWLRKSRVMHDLHKKVIYEGALFEDKILSRKGAIISWNIHKMGGYQAWTIMSILTAEISYQLLVKKNDLNSIYEWLGLND